MIITRSSGRHKSNVWLLSETSAKRNFEFRLKANRVEVTLTSKAKTRDEQDWYALLTEQERVTIFNKILHHYRLNSTDADGVRTAAIGVFEEPGAPAEHRHLIYIGTNVDTQDPYHKLCAERPMIANATTSENHRHGREGSTNKKALILKEVHVLGGRLQREFTEKSPLREKREIYGTCPCGLCTDQLAALMQPSQHVYIHSMLAGPHTAMAVDDVSRDYRQVTPSGIWKTTIGNLNRHRQISLADDPNANSMQRNSYAFLAQQIAGDRRISAPLPSDPGDALGVYHHLLSGVLESLRTRARRDQVPLESEALTEWLRKNVHYVRGAAIELENGQFASAFDSFVNDNAFVAAEVSALGALVPSLGDAGVRRVWALEFNPQAIEQGMLPTSSKDAVERIGKRSGANGGPEFIFFPVPDRPLSPPMIQALRERYSFTLSELSPGAFFGKPKDQARQPAAWAGRGG